FFQAEDGIRDRNVTGVQTCALPIYVVRSVMGRPYALSVPHALPEVRRSLRGSTRRVPMHPQPPTALIDSTDPTDPIERADATERSEERRVGKECRSRRGGGHARRQE